MRRLAVLACAALLVSPPARAAVDKAEAAHQLAFGVKMAQQGSWHEAAFRFTKAVTADPGNAFAQNNLGVALESVGQFEKALEAYEKALKIESTNPRIRENRDRLKAYLSSRTIPRSGAPASAATPAAANPGSTPGKEPAQPQETQPPPAGDPNGASAPGRDGGR